VGHDASSFEARTLTGASLAQERSFYRRLTAFENMLFFARLRYRSKKEAMDGVKTVAEELELGAFLSRRVDQCSTGMVQQLSFARALMGAPRLLILDEPTRSLDEAAIGRLWRAIDHRNEVAVVIASHVAADLEHCDRVHELPT
jgi:ABC-type multidrug transport system ATPase subunit